MKRLLIVLVPLLALLAWTPAHPAGTLTPKGSQGQPLAIRDHAVRVILNNGFAETEVIQIFHNPNPQEVEGLYTFPLPKSASLSEVTVTAGELTLHGEIVERGRGESIYQAEKDRGRRAAIATKEGYEAFSFRVAPIPAGADVTLRLVYYQPIAIDSGVGRYLYPLEEGGTDAAAEAFWHRHDRVDNLLTIDVELRSAYPVADVRAPGLEGASQIQQLGDGHYRLRVEQVDAALDRDFVFYYRLADGLPGRVDLLTHRDDPSAPGTFMLVVTPGIDLAPLTSGADYAFVLDVSGSMEGKLASLADGVSRAIGGLDPEDRFRIVTFNDRARELSRGWVPATPENVEKSLDRIRGLRAGGSTNLYEGLQLGLEDLDDDRATSLILVTDGVTNTGLVDPAEFYRLLQTVDVRIFGFLLGNSANWPLMETICHTSGGFYRQISNRDDILGQVMLARDKVTHEALLDVALTVDGAEVSQLTPEAPKKLYHGQQLVLFGRYELPAPAELKLHARLTGQDRTYRTIVDFPEHDDRYPELERLWALARIEDLERRRDAGLVDDAETDPDILELALAHQLVTEETAMVILHEEAFLEHGVERRNRDRLAREHAAQAARRSAPITPPRADRRQPMFDRPAPRPGGGGGGGSGAVDPWTLLAMAGLAGWAARRALHR